MSLAFDRAGAGPVLVLLHPLGADRHVWEPVMDRLTQERDVIAFDLPGFGDSPPLNGGPHTPAALAAAVADALPPGAHHVAGNSLGGWVALELAAAGRASAVTAIAPAGLWPGPLAPKRGVARTLARAVRPIVPALVRSTAGRRLALASTVAHAERVHPPPRCGSSAPTPTRPASRTSTAPCAPGASPGSSTSGCRSRWRGPSTIASSPSPRTSRRPCAA